MVHFSTFFTASIALALVAAAPLEKRIAQVIADATADWESACLAAGGAEKCNPISQVAFTSLLAAGGNCDQQNAADQMVDLAKTLSNNADMIRLSQTFIQQPRNAPDSLSVPYCQTAPKNTELNGLFHCQFSGSNLAEFSGDQTGNLPLGVSAVNPPGSCPAFTSGPVPAGEQLTSLVQSPGVPASGSSGATPASASEPALSTDTNFSNSSSLVSALDVSPIVPATARTTLVARTQTFTEQNGKDAQDLNQSFTTLTAQSSCNAGEQACVGAGFAQCVAGKFEITSCAGGTQCFALPLVNKAGTSVTCTTESDAAARIAATGVTGGITGA